MTGHILPQKKTNKKTYRNVTVGINFHYFI